MLWRRWQQHKADTAESRAIRRYLERRDSLIKLGEVVAGARRNAEARRRLEVALQTGWSQRVDGAG